MEMPATMLIFAENEMQLPEMIGFAESSGSSSVDYAVLSKILRNYQNQGPVWPEQLVQGLSSVTNNNQYEIIALPATKIGREIAPRLAVSLQIGYVEGVIALDRIGSEAQFRRLSLGGTSVETIKVKTRSKIVTLLVGKVTSLPKSGVIQREIEIPLDPGARQLKELVKEEIQQSSENIQTAEKIVAVGRGIKKKDDISMVQDLADALNAKIGVSRPLVEDLNWFPKERQIGLSGNAVRPKLYIGIGISGQVQHIVGMRDSKVVVAINNDKAAPIFAFADYGVVGDLYTIVPEITKFLKSEQQSNA